MDGHHNPTILPELSINSDSVAMTSGPTTLYKPCRPTCVVLAVASASSTCPASSTARLGDGLGKGLACSLSAEIDAISTFTR